MSDNPLADFWRSVASIQKSTILSQASEIERMERELADAEWKHDQQAREIADLAARCFSGVR